MTLRKNLLAAVLNSAWTALVAFAATPFYLKHLGIEAYGLIGFYAALQAVLQFLDFGIAPTINREVARCAALGHEQRARDLLRSLEVVSVAMGVLIALAVAACAPLIAGHWLRPDQVDATTLVQAICLMGLVVACRWPSGLYLGALLGKQRVVTASAINAGTVTAANLGAVLVLALGSRSIQAFFLCQVAAGACYTLLMRAAAWRAIGHSTQTRFHVPELLRVWRFSAGMSAIAVASIALTQVDKVLLSKLLPLDQFGVYTLSTSVVAALYLLITPLFNVMYPRFSSLVASGDTGPLEALYRTATRLLTTCLFPVALLLSLLSRQFVELWTGNPGVAAQAAPIISVLAGGTALHGVMFLPYALQLAYGETRMALTITVVLTIVITPLIAFLAITRGPIGAACAWLALHTCYLFFGTWVTHRKLLPGTGARWLLVDVGVPLALTLGFGALALLWLRHAQHSLVVQIAIGAAAAGAVALASFLASPGLRAGLASTISALKPRQESC